MPGHYTKSLKKKVSKKPDSFKPKMIMVRKSYEAKPRVLFNFKKMKKREPLKLIKKKKKKGKEAE